MADPVRVPGGLIIAAPTSGAGKTTVTLGLLAALRHAGHRVAAAKVGPDYIDPRFHEAACGGSSINLDGWAMSDNRRAALIARQIERSELILVEGVMGLFDGAPAAGASDDGSTAALAAATGWPVVLVVDAARQARSVAPLVQGFARFDPAVTVAGVILNRVGGTRHAEMLRTALTEIGMPILGVLHRRAEVTLPERHLGLVQAEENTSLRDFVTRAGDWAAAGVDLEALRALAGPSHLATSGRPRLIPPLGQRIAVAQDIAFAFAYPHLLADWRAAGAEVLTFSPLADEAPRSDADAVYLPGGYPELHAGRLSGNAKFLTGLAHAAEASKPIFGECGGYMVLGDGLIDADGGAHRMAGLLPIETSFAERGLTLGYRAARSLTETPFGPAETRLRGHEFHYATTTREDTGQCLFEVTDAGGRELGAIGHRRGSVFGSFLHLIDLG